MNANAIAGWVSNWLTFYTNNPPTGATITQAAYGAAFGDAIGTALLNPTPISNINLPPSLPSTTFNSVENATYNALILNGEGAYVAGVPIGALPTHTPLQGEVIPSGPVITLTTGMDTVPLNASNSTVNGTFGGAGATWTPGDTITAAAGTTGQIFNITGNGTLGEIDPTNLPTNKVSGVQTVNIDANTAFGAVATEAVHGNFTAGVSAGGAMTAGGAMGDWVGLTTLNINSGGNLSFADNVTVDPTTAVNITDTTTFGTSAGSPLTVNGGSVITIIENNLIGPNDGGIVVNGGTGTTSVSITQTETSPSADGIVTITDNNGASTTAAGTITTVVLNGLSGDFTGPDNAVTGPNAIVDNALTHLTVDNTDSEGAGPNHYRQPHDADRHDLDSQPQCQRGRRHGGSNRPRVTNK